MFLLLLQSGIYLFVSLEKIILILKEEDEVGE